MLSCFNTILRCSESEKEIVQRRKSKHLWSNTDFLLLLDIPLLIVLRPNVLMLIVTLCFTPHKQKQ
jgi:hypothetical protein